MGADETLERALERLLFSSRWLLAPFYIALALGLLALIAKAADASTRSATAFSR